MYLTVSVDVRTKSWRAAIVAVAWFAASTPCSAQTLDVRVDLPNASAADSVRAQEAATEALRQFTMWLGPPPGRGVTIVQRVDGRPPQGAQATAIAIDVPWWSAPSAMEIEAAVAHGVARAYWPAEGASEGRLPVADALAWYLQSRIVDRVFNVRYFADAYNTESLRLFGGSVPWTFPTLRLSRWNGGLARDVFLRAGAADIGASSRVQGRRLPLGVSPATVRGALAFASLERYLGWPTLQGALRVLAQQYRDQLLTQAVVAHAIGAAVGRDLEWFFAVAFDESRRLDYGLRSFVTEPASPCAAPECHRTEVVVVRRGTAAFTGTSRTLVEPYEAGEGIVLDVAFEDGQVVTATWDGRAEEKRVAIDSPAPARVARLDPKGVLLLDVNTLDHLRRTSADTNVPVTKWLARWAVWLQNAMLTYTMLL
jgi:hypothetical protein